MNNIPSVDLADFLSDDPRRKQKFVDEIGRAYEEIGFVSLKNHFLSDALVDELYKEVKAFFALPLETKLKYEIPGLGGQRGYVSFGKEHAKGKKEGPGCHCRLWRQVLLCQPGQSNTIDGDHYP